MPYTACHGWTVLAKKGKKELLVASSHKGSCTSDPCAKTLHMDLRRLTQQHSTVPWKLVIGIRGLCTALAGTLGQKGKVGEVTAFRSKS